LFTVKINVQKKWTGMEERRTAPAARDQVGAELVVAMRRRSQMPPYNPPRHLRQGDELPDDFGTRPGDTLTFGAGSYIRAFDTEEFRQFAHHRPDGIVYGRGWQPTIQPGPPAGLLEERPRRRGLNRLLPTGWRRRR
jgi:hypothetical protein